MIGHDKNVVTEWWRDSFSPLFTLSLQIRPVLTACPSAAPCPQRSDGTESKVVLTWMGRGRAQHVGGQELSLWPGRRGLRERLDGIFLPQWITADQAEALGAWSPVGVLAAWGILGMWEALRCQWAAAENTQSFREHWWVYRGLVPADSAFSDLKWRESFLSLNSLLHPSVQRSKTIRHHKQRDRTVITPNYSRLQMQEWRRNLKKNTFQFRFEFKHKDEIFTLNQKLDGT